MMMDRSRIVALAALLGSSLSCAQMQSLTPQLATMGPLTGVWMATGYNCPGGNLPAQEQIQVEEKGGTLIATKIIGDDCVPSGAIGPLPFASAPWQKRQFF